VTAAFLLAAGVIASLAMSSAPRHKTDAGSVATAPGITTAGQSNGVTDAPIATAPPTPTAAASSAPPRPSTTTHSATGATPTSSQPSISPAHSDSQSATATYLAGLVQPGVTYQGVATEYSAADGDGACLFGPAGDMMIAAMNERDYQNSEACGAHILVHAANGAAITVLITNECPYPCAPGQLDLSQQAFAKIADPKAGRIPITWQLISPATTGTISVRYKAGSSQYWCGIQVIGERNPVARLEVSTGSGWQQLPRSSYNYFLSASGTGCGGKIRITDIYGQQLTTAALPVEPDVVQPVRIQFAQH
jgi:expansin